MVDFELKNDDIVIKKNEPNNKLKIKFQIKNNEAPLKIQFLISSVFREEPKNKLKIRFKLNSPNVKNRYTSKVSSIFGKNHDIQHTIMRLKTELGDIFMYPWFGSRLVDYRHEDKFKDEIILQIKKAVEDANYVDNLKTIVSTNNDYSQHMEWHNILLEIFDEDARDIVERVTI